MLLSVDEIRKRLEREPAPEWLRRMLEHYGKTGQYRPEDLRRLLGDPNKSVSIGPSGSLPNNLLQR